MPSTSSLDLFSHSLMRPSKSIRIWELNQLKRSGNRKFCRRSKLRSYSKRCEMLDMDLISLLMKLLRNAVADEMGLEAP